MSAVGPVTVGLPAKLLESQFDAAKKEEVESKAEPGFSSASTSSSLDTIASIAAALDGKVENKAPAKPKTEFSDKEKESKRAAAAATGLHRVHHAAKARWVFHSLGRERAPGSFLSHLSWHGTSPLSLSLSLSPQDERARRDKQHDVERDAELARGRRAGRGRGEDVAGKRGKGRGSLSSTIFSEVKPTHANKRTHKLTTTTTTTTTGRQQTWRRRAHPASQRRRHV